MSCENVFPKILVEIFSLQKCCLRQTVEKLQGLFEKKSWGKSDFPEGGSPQGKSAYSRDLLWAKFQTIPKAFPLFVRLLALKTKEGHSKHIQVILTVVNPEFGSWNLKSGLGKLDGVGLVENRPLAE